MIPLEGHRAGQQLTPRASDGGVHITSFLFSSRPYFPSSDMICTEALSLSLYPSLHLSECVPGVPGAVNGDAQG